MADRARDRDHRLMGPPGAFIMAFFAGIFAVAGVVPVAGWHSPLLLVALAPSVAIFLLAWRASQDGTTYASDPRIGQIIGWSSAAEGVGIFFIINLLINLHLPERTLAGVAAVVALHFVPMARLIPFPRFYALAAGLGLVAIIAFLVPAPMSPPLAGIGAALALWAASLLALNPRR